MTRKILTFLLITISFISCNSQNKDLDQKIKNLLELAGTKDLNKKLVNDFFEIQASQNSNLDTIYLNKIKLLFYKKIDDEFFQIQIPLYKKYFTEDEINGLIDFFESSVGKAYSKKIPLFTSEMFKTQTKFADELVDQAFKEVRIERLNKFNKEINTDSKFKKGTFYYYFPDSTKAYIERNGNIQIERFKNTIVKYDLKWINEGKYTLKLIETN